MRFSASGTVPADEVWHRYVTPERWSEWAPHIQGTRGLTSPLGGGSRGWVVGPLGVRVPVRILDVDPDRLRWSWRVGVGPASVRMDHGVDGTETGCTAWVELPGLLFAYRPLAESALRELVSGPSRTGAGRNAG